MLTLSDNDYTRDYESIFTLRDVHEAFGLDLGLRDYPIFDEAYRATLNQAIYDHFAYRRVASDTPQLFVFYLNRRMRENMPAYNVLYKRVLSEAFDPFATYVSDTAGNNRGTSDTKSSTAQHSGGSTTGKGSNVGTAIVSDTPASFMNDPTEPRYMSQLTQNKANSENSGTSVNDATENVTSGNKTTGDYVSRMRARMGYMGDNVTNMLTSGFMNVDLLVCDMLEPCFMQIWSDEPF